ncbi:cyclic nucleotide-binding domain-containing protein [Gordonia aichiensis]
MTIAPGRTVYRAFDQPRFVLLVSGLARVVASSAEGRKATIRYARSGDVVGAVAVVTDRDEAQESSPGVLTEIPHPWAVSTVATFWWVRWRCAGCGCGRDGHEAGRSRRRV